MDSIHSVRNFIVETFLFGDAGGLKADTSFLDDGIIDSTGMLELVTYLEETFNIQIADEDLVPENLDSLNRIMAFLQKKQIGPSNQSS